jgi:hypothetical protein
MAANGQWDTVNTWVETEIEFVFGGGGKRSHLGRFGRCNTHCSGDIHALGQFSFLYGPDCDPESKPHYLPWLENEEEATEIKERGYFVLNEEDPDSEVLGWAKVPTQWRPEWQKPSEIPIRLKESDAFAAASSTNQQNQRDSRFFSLMG